MTDKCPRCTKAVYHAEKALGSNGKVYHKACYLCKSCNKRLDAHNATEHEKEMYCKACYAKEFGPKGCGYGLGAGALGHTQ